MNHRKLKTLLIIVAFFSQAATSQVGDKYFEITKNLELFTNMFKELNMYYVDDVDPGKLMKTGIDAMLQSLDPYTNYISENQIERYRYLTEGRYDGIGAKIKMIGDYITITEPYEGFAAHEAGLRAGDQIIAVEGESTKNLGRDQVSQMMKGVPGTTMTLSIQRYGQKKPMDVELVRGEVSVPNVPYSGMVDDEIGYVVLTTFTRNAGSNVAKALRNLRKENPEMSSVILDLRNNGGGLLSEAINVCNVFIPKGEEIVSTRGKVKEWDRAYKTSNKEVDAEMPVVILINKRTASASEIVSGTLQDLDRGVVLGQRSYGKGLVQNTREIGYNSRVKLTTAKYYIPSGRCIQSVEYNGGEPADIADSLRAEFQTRAGRKVLDGGGISPDVMLLADKQPSAVRSLVSQNVIFQFANEYYLNNEGIAAIEEFSFEEYDDFVSFAQDLNFSFQTQSEKQFRSLLKTIENESLEEELADELTLLKNEIEKAKADDLIEFKEPIIDLIEEELATRYYFQKGKIKQRLKNDRDITEAIALLKDQNKYQSILLP